jgi:23S rRNA 5-hydroxycytidine C2501 synthase
LPLVRTAVPYPEKTVDFHANVYNESAKRFYERHGAQVTEAAFEALSGYEGREVMKTKLCLLYELGACLKSKDSKKRLKLPLRLCDDRNSYSVTFDCDSCTMSLTYLGNTEQHG